MGREVKRVPMDFDWPLGEVWDGYLMPKRLHEKECETCGGSGYSPEADRIAGQWHRFAGEPFDPRSTGSEPWTEDTPEVRAQAERNYPGRAESVVVNEARRLAEHFNSWSHHLSQADVDTLVAEGRLYDFTHVWSPERRWEPRDPMPEVKAADVNRWSLAGFGHDALNRGIVVEARCKREGVPYLCDVCQGHGAVERWKGQRAEAEAWERIEPPTGDGWQMWSTTSEGSPESPAFATPEELADYCAEHVSVFGHDMADRDQWLKIITGEDFAHVEVAPGVIAM